MTKAVLEQYKRLSPNDKALVSRAAAILVPGASCGVVELAEVAVALLNRLDLNTAEKLITAIATK